MKGYVNLLIDAINKYDENNENSKAELRDLVCMISEKKENQQDVLIRELLYTASHKMRIFGYNVQNGFYSQNATMEQNNSDIMWLRNQSILNRYRSKVWNNNILDKTQQDIVDYYQNLNKKRMLVSAPTSYGKTFIMREILYLNNKIYNNVLLVFPTVALLRENAINMEKLNIERNMGYNVIKSIDNEINLCNRNIFVFTPERALQLLSNYPNIQIDFFFYDEMYKIDEDYCIGDMDEKNEGIRDNPYNKKTFLDDGRAKTFRICLYLLSKKVQDYYLAGPNLSKEKFGSGMITYIKKNCISVKEVNFEPTKRIQVDAYDNKIVEKYKGLSFVEHTESESIRSKKNDRICDVVNYIERNEYGATMLYCTTPSKANEYSTKLANNHQGKEISNKRFLIFIDHLKRNYDIDGSVKEWSFVNILEKGFGMHHGKMPKYIQKEVLDAFNNGVFDLLFCTSTIVEGVNTNAKNMVVLNSTKGNAPLTLFDFKNIIGRAGRYYHNFVGRYFLLDKELSKFDKMDDIELNFITYDTDELDAIDIDNAQYEDLSDNNQIIKNQRKIDSEDYLLTDDVFVKNRLIKKENQEKLLRFLVKNNYYYNKFYRYAGYDNILLQFTNYSAMNTVLDIINNAGLLDDFIVKIYKAISNTYCKTGFYGLLKYEIDIARKGKKTGINNSIDKAYMNAFRTKKDILEYKFPKLLSLFEAVFLKASEIRENRIENFSLSKVIRFYETGVKSYFGEQLTEFGFPVDAIKRIEDNNMYLIGLDAELSKKYVKDNLTRINNSLDDYEKLLLDNALQSVFTSF